MKNSKKNKKLLTNDQQRKQGQWNVSGNKP